MTRSEHPGAAAEGDHPRNRPRLSATLSAPNLERLKAIATDRGKPVSQVLDDLLRSQFLDEDRTVGHLGDPNLIRVARARDALHAALRGELVDAGGVLCLAIALLSGEESE